MWTRQRSLALLVASLAASPPTTAAPSPAGELLDLSFYHSTDTLLDKFTRLADPSRCGSRMWVENLRDEEDPYFSMPVVTFQENSARFDQRPRSTAKVLLNFGAHGRELIGPEVALRVAEVLCGEAESRFVNGNVAASRARISELLRLVEIKLVPVQVPSARRLAEVGAGSCGARRLTPRGVDVNRNYDVVWDRGNSDSGSNEYRGPRPFSEPETRTLAALAQRWRPDLFGDVHSGDRYLAMPFAHMSEGPSNRTDRAAMRHALRRVADMLRRQHPTVGASDDLPMGPASSLGEEPYHASGTALDWMYSKAKVRRSFMLEVFGFSTLYGLRNRDVKAIGRAPNAAANAMEDGLSTSLSAVPTPEWRGTEDDFGSQPGGGEQQRRLMEDERNSLEPPADPVERARRGGLTALQRLVAGLAPRELEYDCVTSFSPTERSAYESTVNAWADAMMVLIDEASYTPEEAARRA